MRKPRIVEKINGSKEWGGEKFQEVHPKDWEIVMATYRADPRNIPAPMIWGHQMFKFPADYGCRLINP